MAPMLNRGVWARAAPAGRPRPRAAARMLRRTMVGRGGTSVSCLANGKPPAGEPAGGPRGEGFLELVGGAEGEGLAAGGVDLRPHHMFVQVLDDRLVGQVDAFHDQLQVLVDVVVRLEVDVVGGA